MSTQTETVKILEDHILHGWRKDPRCCPAALALYDKYPLVDDIYVDEEKFILNSQDETKKEEYALDDIGKEFVRQFDAWEDVLPCTFTATKS